MTPKEKAEDLVTTYRFSLSIPNAPLGDLKDGIAKQCALIALDEILNDNWYIATYEDLINRKAYWEEVKQEIEKL